MRVTFYGAAREVTGSMHLLTMNQDNVLLDCGMYQGRRKEADLKNRVLPFDPAILTNMLLSHAHIDHSGRIPLLTKKGFSGRIISTRATADACGYLLPDSAHIQESDANYLNYKVVRELLSEITYGSQPEKNRQAAILAVQNILKKDKSHLNVEAIDDLIRKYHLESVAPIYTTADAERALSFFDGVPYGEPVPIGKNMECTLYDAGHILGSAISIVNARNNGKRFSVCFSGDIGRFDKPILQDPTLNFAEKDRDIDLLIMESTYGDRVHEPVTDMAPHFKKVFTDTIERGGTLLIPSFAFGRTQELLYVIHEMYHQGDVPKVPIYVDSPLASNITQVFAEHPEMYDAETHADFLNKGDNPFTFKQLRFTSSVEESMSLMREKQPHVVISASGMCEAGRILHHLRYKMHNPKNTILIVGFMAQNTLGRRILEEGEQYAANGRKGPAPRLRLMNKEYPLKAQVEKIGGFSAHGDQKEMLRFIERSNLNIKKIALVHGEEEQCLAFADTLRKKGRDVIVPKAGECIDLTN
ncbi:MAG: MBL fold metallo-hydrolase [Desulfosalsimonadaceae bacterium]